MPATYVDSSAIIKLVAKEPESAALRRYLRRRRPLVSSALARTELLRALLPFGDIAVAAGRRVLLRIELARINVRVLSTAATLRPLELRSLDAIHLATAEQFGDEIAQLVTYDKRLADAAEQLGHRVVMPS